MDDAPDDQTDDQWTTTDESRTGKDVPQDADWELLNQVPYDPADADGLTTTIIYAVADADGVSPSDIRNPPLYEVVDTAALEAALFGNGGGVRASQCTTEFMYQGYRIEVHTEGWVRVYEQVGR